MLLLFSMNLNPNVPFCLFIKLISANRHICVGLNTYNKPFGHLIGLVLILNNLEGLSYLSTH